MLKLYRICTEGTGEMRAKAIAATAAKFEDFTALAATGYYDSKAEDALVLEIFTDDKREDDIKALAARIRVVNKQACVLVQILDAAYWMAI